MRKIFFSIIVCMWIHTMYAEIEVPVTGTQTITVPVVDLRGGPLPEEESIYIEAFDDDGRGRTDCVAISGLETGESTPISVMVAKRYTLRFRRQTEDGRALNVVHRFNVRPPLNGDPHERGSAKIDFGYFMNFKVVEKDNTSVGVPNVRIVAGSPRKLTDANGEANHILVRPIYHQFHYPPLMDVTVSDPRPIIPDEQRAYQITESDSLPGEFARVFEVDTAHGIFLNGKITNTGGDPISQILLRSFGARRELSRTRTDANGEYTLIGVRKDEGNEYKNTVMACVNYADPYLPKRVLHKQELLENTNLGTSILSDASYETAVISGIEGGGVLGSGGTDEKIVFFHNRMTNEAPHCIIHWGKVTYNSTLNRYEAVNMKCAPRNRARVYTRYWNKRYRNKWFSWNGTDFPTMNIAAQALIHFNLKTSVEEHGGNATPMADVFVQAVDANTDEVYDHCRTGGEGDGQLRVPNGINIKLRYIFAARLFSYCAGIEERVTSENFPTQESAVFNLTGASIYTMDDIYITPLVLSQTENLMAYIESLPEAAFSSTRARGSIIRYLEIVDLYVERSGEYDGAGVINSRIRNKLIITGAISICNTIRGSVGVVGDSVVANPMIVDEGARNEVLSQLDEIISDSSLLRNSTGG